MPDSTLGLSQRFIAAWTQPEHVSEVDSALFLVSKDTRDLPFDTKLADALQFMRERRPLIDRSVPSPHSTE